MSLIGLDGGNRNGGLVTKIIPIINTIAEREKIYKKETGKAQRRPQRRLQKVTHRRLQMVTHRRLQKRSQRRSGIRVKYFFLFPQKNLSPEKTETN